MTPYRIAKESMTNYSNLKDALAGKRPFSDAQLSELSKHPAVPYTEAQLKAWKMIDEYGLDAVKVAYEEAKKIREERKLNK